MHIIKCSLCNIEFDKDDELYKFRIERHSIFHNKARIQKRNTAQGDPIYE